MLYAIFVPFILFLYCALLYHLLYYIFFCTIFFTIFIFFALHCRRSVWFLLHKCWIYKNIPPQKKESSRHERRIGIELKASLSSGELQFLASSLLHSHGSRNSAILLFILFFLFLYQKTIGRDKSTPSYAKLVSITGYTPHKFFISLIKTSLAKPGVDESCLFADLQKLLRVFFFHFAS